MKLTPRLLKIAEMVPCSESMADIGTDHAYLPVFLLEQEKIRRAVACDINKGPLQRAASNVAERGRMGDIELRLGSGFEPLIPGEVDGAVIAGMGGLMMIEIMRHSPHIAASFQWLILQPQNHVAEIKKYVCSHHFRIVRECLAREGNQLYEMMEIIPGKAEPVTLFEAEIGVTNAYKQDPLFPEHIRKLIRKRNFLIDGIAVDTDNETNRQKREMAVIEKQRLEELL